jgi:hypothetical protein
MGVIPEHWPKRESRPYGLLVGARTSLPPTAPPPPNNMDVQSPGRAAIAATFQTLPVSTRTQSPTLRACGRCIHPQ